MDADPDPLPCYNLNWTQIWIRIDTSAVTLRIRVLQS